MSDDDYEPTGRALFDEEEWEAFVDAVTSVLYGYGAEDQDVESGTLELAAGQPVEIYYFDLDPLAALCRQSPREEWRRICNDRIDAWCDGADQRAWMVEVGFAEAAETLDVWLAHEPQTMFVEKEPGAVNPDDPYSVRVAEGLYAAFTVEAPENEVTDELRTWVSKGVVEAWGVDDETLLEAARARMRRQPAPVWHRREYPVRDRDGAKVNARALSAQAHEDAESPLAGWILLLDEILTDSVPDSMSVGVPASDKLFVAAEHVVAQRIPKYYDSGHTDGRQPVSPLAYPLSAVRRRP
ncbi:hypothetical protein AB0I28_24830 [Phytomonospora sp. NPDC050363]|uniref:hypothetical protein n=1 Tax=Phytomonospora sp. NPDC050363 TaxID=3155642 RepID=UPI0033DDD5AB